MSSFPFTLFPCSLINTVLSASNISMGRQSCKLMAERKSRNTFSSSVIPRSLFRKTELAANFLLDCLFIYDRGRSYVLQSGTRAVEKDYLLT